ncbi:MAG TPA: hypothetical protein GX524_00095 [Firmicutes bacterium]|jgi:predicted nucleotide-binding protein (sugar kinase/HSP70/actin superfamily)|nr:hypothetical protein [Bacillota bacterium]
MRVGVPRCLSFYYLFPFYRTFLRELGVDFVETPASTQKDLDNLRLCTTDEPCVSVKVAFSHSANLLEQGVDALFVPTVVSLERDNYCCPKMMGLPSMLRAGLDLPGSQIISPIIDAKDNPNTWQATWIQAGSDMGARSRRRIMAGLRKGITAWRDAERKMHQFELALTGLLDYPKPGLDFRKESFQFRATQADERIDLRAVTGVMGHAYLLHDTFGKTIIRYASDCGPVILPEMISRKKSRKCMETIFEGEKMWTIEGHILGSCLYLIRTRQIDRLILVTAFSCGPLSIIENYIASEADKYKIPLLYLSVDEHTGEAGLITRLEAFMDACKGRWRHESQSKEEPACDLPKTLAGEIDSCKFESPFASCQEPVGIVNMGHLNISLAALLGELGVEVRIAGSLSDDIVNSGKELAPEFICYPMVTLLGQMRSLIEQGISRIIMVQGKGKCRLGWYAQVMGEILNRAGFSVQIFATDSPFPLRINGRKFLGQWKQIVGAPMASQVARAAALAVQKQAMVDRAGDILREVRAREKVRGTGESRYKEFLAKIHQTTGFLDSKSVFRQYHRDMKSISTICDKPLKIAVVGEIYVVNEPFVNKDVEKMLGSMEQRVRVYRRLDVTNWLGCHLFKTPRAVLDYRRAVRAACNYIPVSVGGHGQESVGETVLAKQGGMDGVLHLFPFTCMPEIIAQNILVRVSSDLDIPVLSLMISEQTGVAGLRTRLEAFCDLLDGRRKNLAGV